MPTHQLNKHNLQPVTDSKMRHFYNALFRDELDCVEADAS